MRAWRRAALLLTAALAVCSCKTAKHYTTTVEVLQVRRFGQGTGMLDLEYRYVDCPGDARRIMRGDKAFAACAANIKKGDRLSAEVVLNYFPDRGIYRNDLVHLGDCPVHLDLNDAANYERYQNCEDVKASGLNVGVRCTRRRGPEVLAKCPWLRR